MSNKSINAGFTLIELLIAMAIFTALSSIAYFSLVNVIKQSQTIEEKDIFLRKLQRAITIIEHDFMQLAPRSIRDENGDFQPALNVISKNSQVEFSSHGQAILNQENQSSLVRIRYDFKNNKIYRKIWHSLDRTSNTSATTVLLLDGVEEFNIQFKGKKNFQNKWPLDADKRKKDLDTSLPQAIHIKLIIKNFGELNRYIFGATS